MMTGEPISSCPCCGQAMPEPESSIDRIRLACDRHGLRVRWDDTVGEPAANLLIGYTSNDALRRRIELGKDTLRYSSDRNGRRRYALADIAAYLSA